MGGAGVFRGGLRFQCTEVRWGEHLNAKESGGDTLLVQRNQGGKHFSAKESVGGGGGGGDFIAKKSGGQNGLY